MPRKIDLITELYKRTIKDITSDSVAWRAFLHSAAYQYKYPFADQVLIYAQRPMATACAETQLWNQHFGRWVNRGATGIALIDGKGAKNYLSYVFDVSDTHHRDNKPFEIWGLKPEYEGDVIEALQNRFIDEDKPKERITDAVIAAAINLGADNITDYLQELSYEKEGSFLEEYDEDNLRVRFLLTVQASVAYTVLTRLGYTADDFVGKEMFEWVHEFNTPATVNILGTATSDISEICLREIERTVKSVEKSIQRENRTFDGKSETEYNNGGKAETLNRNGGNINDIDVQNTERRTDPELGAARADEPSDREVRSDEIEFLETAPKGNVHDDTDRGQAEQLSSRDRRDGESADLGEYIPDGTEPWGNGEDESRESDAVGTDDELDQELSRGRSVDVPNLRISDSTLPEISDPESLIQILRHGDHLRQSKENIVSFLTSDASETEKAEYVKKAYPPLLFAEFYKQGTENHLGYRADDKGLLLYAGNYPSRTEETLMEWDFVTKLIEALISDGNYLDTPPVKQEQQMSLFDMDMPVVQTVQETKQTFDTSKQMRISQEVIDEFLRLGGCMRNSAQRIYGFYRRANNQAENVAFLKSEYQKDSVGIVVNNKNYAFKWDDDGVRISTGDRVSEISAVYLPWEAIDKRIRELLEMGQYLPQAEAQKADEIWEKHVADQIAFLYREDFENIPAEYKTVYRFTWPEVQEFYRNIFKDQEQLPRFIEEMLANEERVKDYPGRFRRFHDGNKIAALTATFLREPVAFPEADPYILPPKQFVTQDKIDSYLIDRGTPFSDGKLATYSFFLLNSDLKARAAFLSKSYGTGGTGGRRTDSDYNGKGLALYGGLQRRTDGVLLKWPQVANRIDHLIKKGKYLTEREKTELDRYERKIVGEKIRLFYSKKPPEIPLPYKDHGASGYWEDIKDLESQITERERLAEIVEGMQSVFEALTPETEHYERDKKNLEDVRNYLTGKFNIFPHSPYRSKTPFAPDKLLPKQEPDIREEVAENGPVPVTEYDLKLGATVYIGKDEMEIISLSKDMVELFDGTIIPLEMDFETFMSRLRENKLNDGLKKIENTIDAENTELDDVARLLKELHIDDIQLSYDENGIIGKDTSNEWRGKDLYGFLLNEAVALDEEGKVVEGFTISQSVVDAVVEHSKKYGAEIKKDAPQENSDREFIEMPVVMEEPQRTNSVPVYDAHPDIPDSEKHNYRITNDEIGMGGAKEKFRKNMDAIRLLHDLETQNRLATPQEQETLAQYSGWGGLADAFDENKDHWHLEYNELKNLLTHEEYEAAKESTLTAFYTPPVVIKAMYQALNNMGFKRGNILEPSCGVGNFMGLIPESMDAKMYGVELDSLSGRIARQLYQKNGITIDGYENTNFPDSFFDVAIGNIPFEQFKVLDKKYDKYNFLVHDYFFAKTLDKVRPGGVIAFVTSSGTLDKENPSVRKYIAQRADFLGAIRLPDNAFSGAGTRVMTDIIFLQKRDRLIEAEADWIHLGKDENGIVMNQYFVDNPDMIMGEMVMRSGPFGPEPTCKAYGGEDLGELLSEAVSNIHAEISELEVEELPGEKEGSDLLPADPNVKNYSFTLVDGKVYYRQNSIMIPVETSLTGENRIKGLIGIRDAVRALIDAQVLDYPAYEIERLQYKLNQRYDDFTKKYGLINSRGNASVFSDDNSYFLLCSLEILDENKELKAKADMFTKRTIKPQVTIEKVDTASEALAVSIGERACVDMAYMEKLTGRSEEDLYADLKGVVFLNPLYEEEGRYEPKYLPADEYLSGNVREKLRIAQSSAKINPEEFSINVEALEKVQPIDLTPAEISVQLGTTWIPQEDIEEFMYDLLGTSDYYKRYIRVKFIPQLAEWIVTEKSYDRNNVKVNNVFGTTRINAYEIIEQTLNLKNVQINDYVEDGHGNVKPVLNKKETAIAQGKQEQIRRAFEDWVWKDPERRERLCRLYNEKFNSVRPREFDGSHIKFYGMNPEITLRKHQRDAVARIMYGGNSLLAHVVGAGKTFTMVAAAQESKRLGLCNKSMFVVPNHLIEQWASEYLQLYPSANILVATKKDFETKNRKKFCARIATGDYDAVIIGHSQFEKIPVSVARQIRTLEKERDGILQSISRLKAERGEYITIKRFEKTKKQIEAKLKKLNDQTRKDDVVTFEELGVDRLFVDEAHYYKNLAAHSKMRNVAGIAQTEAQKSSDLYMKCRYLDEITGNKGSVFATGTPISNTMVEFYTMQKYLQYDVLHHNDLLHFDAWASTYGETVTAIELAPEGSGYRAKTRFARFNNIPELISMFKQVADIQTSDMLNLPVPKANYHIVKVQPSDIQREMVKSFGERAEKIHSGIVKSDEDNMLLVTNDGRKAALDQRLLNPMLPDFEGSKVNKCVQNIFDIWERTAENRSAQLVFCDLSTPKNDGTFNVYDDIRNKLIARGIPPEEIAFIHTADTDVRKKELFAKVRSGQVRVLMGSTFKMGAGTNVQERLVALHDLDVPWRPSDLEQRAGRIVRQGNTNLEVDLYRYVTEGTFDAYSYQLLESKQKFISQIMTSKSPVRSAEDVDETALSYAEIKALASGNPKIMEKMQLDADVAKLKLQKASHLSQRYSLENALVRKYPKEIADTELRIKGLEADIETAKNNSHPGENGFCPMVIMGATYTEKADAGNAILDICGRITNQEPRKLGHYRGFDTEIGFDGFDREFYIKLRGELIHTVKLGKDASGIITRLDNAIEKFGTRKTTLEAELAELHKQVENAKAEITKPFPDEAILEEKCRRLDELNAELNMDKRENEIVDEGEEQDSVESKEKNKQKATRDDR